MNTKTTITLLNERNNFDNDIIPRNNNLFTTQEIKFHQYTAAKPEIAHKAFQPLLYLGQCIGILPLYGISGLDSSKLRFKWLSRKTIVSIIMALLGLVLLIFTTAYQGITGKTIGSVSFYFVTTLSMMFYILLAREWKDLITHWKRVMDLMEINGKEIIQTTKTITIIMGILSLCEHLLANLNTFTNDNNKTAKQFFEHKFINIFHVIDYSLWRAILVLAIHFQNTIVWNFSDIFIMNVATIMSLMFKYFYNDVNSSIKQDKSVMFWKKKREMYCQLSDLMKAIDDKISNIVLLSFGSNLFFICKQLYHSITPSESFFKNIYFYMSFGFLLLRTCGVCFTAANIYECSKKPLNILYTIPSEQYNIEVQRLFDTINTETLALSGYNFFTLNRKLILTVAGTIVTYEIVLYQLKALKSDD